MPALINVRRAVVLSCVAIAGAPVRWGWLGPVEKRDTFRRAAFDVSTEIFDCRFLWAPKSADDRQGGFIRKSSVCACSPSSWRASTPGEAQPDRPSRSEAIRRLVERGLKAS